MLTIFSDEGNLDDVIVSLKKIWRYTTKKYLLSLRNFIGRSISWGAFFGFNLSNYYIISFFSTKIKKNR